MAKKAINIKHLCSQLDAGHMAYLDLSLSCEENLVIPLNELSLGGGRLLTEIYELFPQLAQHKDTPCVLLSLDLQQQLVLARVLRSGVDLSEDCYLKTIRAQATAPSYALSPSSSQSPEDHHLAQPLALLE